MGACKLADKFSRDPNGRRSRSIIMLINVTAQLFGTAVAITEIVVATAIVSIIVIALLILYFIMLILGMYSILLAKFVEISFRLLQVGPGPVGLGLVSRAGVVKVGRALDGHGPKGAPGRLVL